MPKIVKTKLLRRYYDDLLAGHFGINKIKELIAQKYYQPTHCHNIKVYITGYDVCSAIKAMRYKFYRDQ